MTNLTVEGPNLEEEHQVCDLHNYEWFSYKNGLYIKTGTAARGISAIELYDGRVLKEVIFSHNEKVRKVKEVRIQWL